MKKIVILIFFFIFGCDNIQNNSPNVKKSSTNICHEDVGRAEGQGDRAAPAPEGRASEAGCRHAPLRIARLGGGPARLGVRVVWAAAPGGGAGAVGPRGLGGPGTHWVPCGSRGLKKSKRFLYFS